MTNHESHLTSKHLLICLAVIVGVALAVAAGAGSSIALFLLICPLMMGAMMYVMMRGMGGRDR